MHRFTDSGSDSRTALHGYEDGFSCVLHSVNEDWRWSSGGLLMAQRASHGARIRGR